jgi:hypothetical protein
MGRSSSRPWQPNSVTGWTSAVADFTSSFGALNHLAMFMRLVAMKLLSTPCRGSSLAWEEARRP